MKEAYNDQDREDNLHHCDEDMVVCWIRAAGGGSRSLLPIFDTRTSRGVLLSYRLGATNIMPHVPAMQANVNIQRRIRSRTMATYFQSSITCNVKEDVI